MKHKSARELADKFNREDKLIIFFCFLEAIIIDGQKRLLYNNG
ncbi:hypothetical protein [Anaerocolumna xylanovorans]|nr:hypothetical protein [Anaerocolumna xylanovorans]